MCSSSNDIELVTFTGELKPEQNGELLLTETIVDFSEYDLDDEATRSFIFIEKDPSCERTTTSISENVPVPSLNLNLSEKKSGWKALESPRPERNWSRLVPDEWEAGGVKTAEADDDTKAIQLSSMERSNSRFTSYVDLDSTDAGEMELEMKPNLLEGEMMITQADKVCLYSSQPGG